MNPFYGCVLMAVRDLFLRPGRPAVTIVHSGVLECFLQERVCMPGKKFPLGPRTNGCDPRENTYSAPTHALPIVCYLLTFLSNTHNAKMPASEEHAED